MGARAPFASWASRHSVASSATESGSTRPGLWMRCGVTPAGAWYWFEELMTYCNARLPQGLLTAYEGVSRKRTNTGKRGSKSLDFLLALHEESRAQGIGYAPIGNQGWYKKEAGAAGPAQFEQNSVDAGALAGGLSPGLSNYRPGAGTQRSRWMPMAWYDGYNISPTPPMLDRQSGGVHDGIFEAGINSNMGAESVISVPDGVSRVSGRGRYAIATFRQPADIWCGNSGLGSSTFWEFCTAALPLSAIAFRACFNAINHHASRDMSGEQGAGSGTAEICKQLFLPGAGGSGLQLRPLTARRPRANGAAGQ